MRMISKLDPLKSRSSTLAKKSARDSGEDQLSLALPLDLCTPIIVVWRMDATMTIYQPFLMFLVAFLERPSRIRI